MGGGTDINLFPQLASVKSPWRVAQDERYAVEHPGTFCLMADDTAASWTPSQLEYGIYKMPPADAFGFWGTCSPIDAGRA